MGYEECSFWLPRDIGPIVTSSSGILISVVCILFQFCVVSSQLQQANRTRNCIQLLSFLFCFLSLIQYALRLNEYETFSIRILRAMAVWLVESAFVLFWNMWVQEASVGVRVKRVSSVVCALLLFLYAVTTVGAIWAWRDSNTKKAIGRGLLLMSYLVFSGPVLLLLCLLFLFWSSVILFRFRRLNQGAFTDLTQQHLKRSTMRKLSFIILACECCMVSRMVIETLEFTKSRGAWDTCVMDDNLWELLNVYLPYFLRATIIIKFSAIPPKVVAINPTTEEFDSDEDGGSDPRDALIRNYKRGGHGYNATTDHASLSNSALGISSSTDHPTRLSGPQNHARQHYATCKVVPNQVPISIENGDHNAALGTLSSFAVLPTKVQTGYRGDDGDQDDYSLPDPNSIN